MCCLNPQVGQAGSENAGMQVKQRFQSVEILH